MGLLNGRQQELRWASQQRLGIGRGLAKYPRWCGGAMGTRVSNIAQPHRGPRFQRSVVRQQRENKPCARHLYFRGVGVGAC